VNERETKPKLLVLVGPTAVGKTQLSLHIAERFRCEIISGDSMQVYRGMDIGTAKASPMERADIPHHLIDTHNPDESFSVSDFQSLARDAIAEIHQGGKLPFIVGGTGLYIESVCYGYQFSESGSDEQFRSELSAYADQFGEQALHDKLKRIDPGSAERLHPNDRRRVIRALEIAHLTGIILSEHLKTQKLVSPYELCLIGLTMDRALLYKRIEERIDEMLEQGLVREVERLLAEGYTGDLVAMQGLGYKEMISYIEGKSSYEEAVALLKRNTRRFAKRQLSWFRHMKDIQWVDVTQTQNFSAHLQTISDIIAGKFGLDKEYITEQRF
jgi:tRNA dimethylallyltransferase